MQTDRNRYPEHRPSFIRAPDGAGVDLVLESGNKFMFFDFKHSKAPKTTRGFHTLINDFKPAHSALVAPVDEDYFLNKDIKVMLVAGDLIF